MGPVQLIPMVLERLEIPGDSLDRKMVRALPA